MIVPVKDITYTIWDPVKHEPLLHTIDRNKAELIYRSHARKNELELWKFVTRENGYNVHIKID